MHNPVFLHVKICISLFGVCRCFNFIICIVGDVVAFVGNEDFNGVCFVHYLFPSFVMSLVDFEANMEDALEASMAEPAAAHRVATAKDMRACVGLVLPK